MKGKGGDPVTPAAASRSKNPYCNTPLSMHAICQQARRMNRYMHGASLPA